MVWVVYQHNGLGKVYKVLVNILLIKLLPEVPLNLSTELRSSGESSLVYQTRKSERRHLFFYNKKDQSLIETFLSARLHFERDLSVRLRFIIYDYDYIVKDEENISTACTSIEHYAGKASNESWDSVLQRLKAKDIKDCCQPNGHLIFLDQTTKSWWLQ